MKTFSGGEVSILYIAWV